MAIKRIVVVGCGSIGQRHARLLARRPEISVELCDTSEACLAEAATQCGHPPAHRDFEAMLATGPDMVLIATPHSCHAEQTIAALRAGAHVLCEKPMSDTLADAERMAEAARSAGTILDFGFTLHFHPALRRLKELIASGALGTVLHLHCRVGTYITLVSSRSRHQAGLEGAILLDYVHQPDTFHWLLGAAPAGVYMTGTLSGDLPLRSSPNIVDITLDYASPLSASIHLNYVQMPQRHHYEVIGDRAWAFLDMETNTLRVGSRDDQQETCETIPVQRDQIFEAEHQAFLHAVAGRRAPESPAESAIISMRVMDAALRSWKQRRRVEVDGSAYFPFPTGASGNARYKRALRRVVQPLRRLCHNTGLQLLFRAED